MTTRNDLLGCLHQAVKQIGLDEDDYRDKLEREFGVRSAKNLSDRQLEQALALFPVRRAAHAHHGKIKALFIAAHNLGIIEAGTDAALDAFIKRQTGKQRLSFVTPAEANSVTEALKAMLGREGFTVPDVNDGGMEVRRTLLRAQWKKLYALKAVKVESPWALDKYVSAPRYLTFAGSIIHLNKAQLDRCARDLGAWIRREMAKAARISAA